MLGGFRLDLSIVLMLIVTCLIVFIVAKMATRNLSVENPGKMQNFMEWAVEFVRNIISSTMSMEKGKHFVGLGLTMIMFIFVGNMLGLPFSIVTDYHDPAKAHIFGQEIVSVTEGLQKSHAEGVGVVWWKSPTADLGVTMGLALVVFLLSHGIGIVKNTKAYFKHYFQPFVFFFPINIIETLSKLLTHGIRLFANIFAGEVLISTIMGLSKLGIIGTVMSIPLLMAWQGFSIFIGTIQAFVFTILMMVYLSQNVESHEEHEH
ncbi:F0F1 ATP synthase subunit A [Paenibacillus sp.]|jgi:F-type H+-transporting ATPase subunit a|uniref:F0F1 ATP synthase subunit A n=1 Tax=Paenibacillus sp. TaxID=58172 RepID=UPI00283833FF|nr:F0F1 ATP synthase subunit A [Paenibacillus sp.]MDR0266705.1 F0F1 ATP synthase subunit A [Paenibacillus sp.]